MDHEIDEMKLIHLKDIKYEDNRMTPSQEDARNIKNEPDGLNEICLKPEVIDVKEETDPISPEFLYIGIKSESADLQLVNSETEIVSDGTSVISTSQFLDEERVDSAALSEQCETQQATNATPHSRTLHGKSFPCEQCGRVFSRSGNLKVHMNIHTGLKPFSCNYCGKLFSKKNDLLRHINAHSGKKPFFCEECGKSFSQRSNLKVHLRIHSGRKQFSCTECGMLFSQKGHLDRHMITHTGFKPFSCSECGQLFSKMDNLKCHMNIHTGHKPFSCSECGKLFSLRHNLIVHLRIHSGQKPFSCNVCTQFFSQRSNLKRHIRRIHSGHKKIV